MLYKLKHIPTGLYYQPHKHRGSNFSKRGKIYQTKANGLSNAIRNESKTFSVYVQQGSPIHNITKNLIEYVECSWNQMQLIGETKVIDWVIE